MVEIKYNILMERMLIVNLGHEVPITTPKIQLNEIT